MKILAFFVLVFTLNHSSLAFTLNNNSDVTFNSNEVTINVSSDSCSNVGHTGASFLEKIMEAMELYWNSVSTSAIVLKKGSVLSSVSVSSITDVDSTSLSTDMYNLGSSGSILAACSSNSAFDGSTTTLGVGGIGRAGGDVRGYFLLNARSDSPMSGNSDLENMATIAHEIGHALGLGHSENELALMYYSIGAKTQEELTEDDKDGITYLYPHEDVVPASCGTIAFTDSGNGDGGNFILTLLGLMILAVAALKRQKKLLKQPSYS